MMFEPVRGGTRGGQAEFKWSDVSADKDRENYLGHSINAPTGRWQKNKDVHWYNRDKKDTEVERLEEIRKVKELEAEALSVALGFEPSKKAGSTTTTGAPVTGANAIAPVSQAIAPPGKDSDKDDEQRAREKEEKRRLKEARKEEKREEKRARREARRAERHTNEDIQHRRQRDRDRSRSASPYHRQYPPRRSRSRSPRPPRRIQDHEPDAYSRRDHDRYYSRGRSRSRTPPFYGRVPSSPRRETSRRV